MSSMTRWLWLLPFTKALVLDPRRISGIWKLRSSADLTTPVDDVLLRLQANGSFRQCNEDYVEGYWLSGQWQCDGDQLILALNRQYYGPSVDTVLQGHLSAEQSGLVIEGSVECGKFMYPKQHRCFFDAPMLVDAESVGVFTLTQAVASASVVEEERLEPSTEPVFTVKDFYDRRFILTTEPLEGRRTDDDEPGPVDIRALPLTFYRNQTFSMTGINKILRGRYIVENDQLSFQVSLFGAGRSAPGSVYSEGPGLTADDRRSYTGTIMSNQGRLYVDGAVTIGSDLGSDARPEPVATFLLMPLDPVIEKIDEEENDDNHRESVFD